MRAEKIRVHDVEFTTVGEDVDASVIEEALEEFKRRKQALGGEELAE